MTSPVSPERLAQLIGKHFSDDQWESPINREVYAALREIQAAQVPWVKRAVGDPLPEAGLYWVTYINDLGNWECDTAEAVPTDKWDEKRVFAYMPRMLPKALSRWDGVYGKATAPPAPQESELQAARGDAKRYRLIRDDEKWDVVGPMFDVEWQVIGTEQLQGAELDAACDAAIAAEQGGKV